MKHKSIARKVKKVLSVLLAVCIQLIHLPVDTVYAAPDSKPEGGSVIVDGVDLLNSDFSEYPGGISYGYVDQVNVITVSGAAITMGYQDGGRYSGIFVKEAGDVEIVLIGDNTINIANQVEPEPMEGNGIFVGGGNLNFSGTGSLTIASEGRSIHLDAYGNAGNEMFFTDTVTVNTTNSIFTEGGVEGRPNVHIKDTVNVSSNGIECGNENAPIVDPGASYENTYDPGSGGEPGSGTGLVNVNGVDLLTQAAPEGVGYSYNEDNSIHVITLTNVGISSGYQDGGRYSGIFIKEAGDVEIVLIGDNTINIANQVEPEPMEGNGVFVGGGNLTFSGTGRLVITSEGRSIHLDAYGNAGKEIFFTDTVTITASNSIFTEGGVEGRPNVYVRDTANVTSNGIECGNENAPLVDPGASYENTYDPGPGGDPGHGGDPAKDGPFNLSVGGVDLVLDGEVLEESISNLELVFYEDLNYYSLYLSGGTYGGIYSEGVAGFGIFAEGNATLEKLTKEGYEDYSIVMRKGGEISNHDFLKEYDYSIPPVENPTLTLKGGILAYEMLNVKEDIILNIGSAEERANKGIVALEMLRVYAGNQAINIWSNSVGVEGVHEIYGFKLESSVDVIIDSTGTGAADTLLMVGEGSTLRMTYVDKGDFTPAIYKWDYMDMTGSIDEYANMPFTEIYNLSEGVNTEDKYNLIETATSFELVSTAKRLYALGYNYDNDRDGTVDNPDEEIKNGRLSIKGATGMCWASSDGFVDYHFEAGSLVTIELLPDYGYQYEAGSLSYNLMDTIDTTPGEVRAYYTFVMPDNNVHLYAGFKESSDIIINNSSVISNAGVNIGANEINGNVAFKINTDTPSIAEIQAISEQAGNKKICAYLDMTLDEHIIKAGTEDAWVTELTELNEPVTISIELSESLRGKTGYSVVRMHNSQATILTANYSNGFLTFDTDQFSTYAIIFQETTPSVTPPIYNPPTIPIISPSITPIPKEEPVVIDKGLLIINTKISKGDEYDSTEAARIPSTPDILDIFGKKEVERVQFNINGAQATGQTSNSIMLPTEILNKAKEVQKEVSITVIDEEGREQYTWTFDGVEAALAGKEMSEVNLRMEVSPIEDNETLSESMEENVGVVLSFDHEGTLPVTGKIRIYVGHMENVKPGMSIFLYHYNKRSGKLDSLPNSNDYLVDQDGYITIRIAHCSDYIVLTKKAKAIQTTSLIDQIEVKISNKTLYLGGNKDNSSRIVTWLPETLELVSDLNKAKRSNEATGGVTVNYKSSNNKIATIDQNGNIAAVGTGIAVITTRVTLYDGTSKMIRKVIRVREAYIEIEESTSTMKLNDSFNFKIKAYGYDKDQLQWYTTRRSRVVINKKTGRAKAVSKGTDYVTLQLGENVLKRIKVIVN